MELSTYFRINAAESGQFERTLIIADKGAYVSYLEGCTAPMRDENQLHAAVVELVALDDAEIKYSTVQNWYPGDAEGKGGIYNFVTKRADCRGDALQGVAGPRSRPARRSPGNIRPACCAATARRGEFYSIAITNNRQQADTGTKMIHLGPGHPLADHLQGHLGRRTRPTPTAAWSRPTRRPSGARNFTQCDSLLIGKHCAAHTVPYIEARNGSAKFEHEATTTRLSEDQLFYAMQRGLSQEEAVRLLVNGFVSDVLQELPMEFAVEAQKLVAISLEG